MVKIFKMKCLRRSNHLGLFPHGFGWPISLIFYGGIFSLSTFANENYQGKFDEQGIRSVNSYEIEGNLASTKSIGCVALDNVTNDVTPPDLYKAAGECIAQGKYDLAYDLFALGGIYARFDAERITDETAGQGGEILILKMASDISEKKKAKFLAAIEKVSKNAELLLSLCGRIRKVGAPGYYPKYMILHGMKAFLGDPFEGALSETFDHAATWERLQSDYLHCPQ